MKRMGLLWLAGWMTLGVAVQAESLEDDRPSSDLLRIYLIALSMIDSKLTVDYQLNTPEDRQAIVEDIRDNLAYAGSAAAAEISMPTPLADRFDRFLDPRVYRESLRRQIHPAEEEKRSYYESHRDEFQIPDGLEGARILVESGPDLAGRTDALKQELESSGKPFREVASEFYRAMGREQDGYFGWVRRGSIRDDLFDLFYRADPEAPFFGRVETPHGMLFGKTFARQPGGPEPYEEVEKRVEDLLVQQLLERRENEFREREASRQGLHLLYPVDATRAPELNAPVFRLGEKAWTYADALEASPDLMGDRQAGAYARTVVSLAADAALLLGCTEAHQVRQSQDYRFLSSALEAQWKANEAFNRAFEGQGRDEAALRRFYDERRTDLYRKPDEVQLTMVLLPLAPEQTEEGRIPGEAAVKQLLKIRDAWALSPDPEHFSFDRFSDVSGLKVVGDDKWVGLDQLDRQLGMDVEKRDKGYLSAILPGQEAVRLYRLRDRRPGGVEPFEAVRSRVEFDFWLDSLRQFRAELRRQRVQGRQ
jgi:hypothetical protein